MRPTAPRRHSVPLGLRFSNRQGKEYEVVCHYFGTEIKYILECTNGWVLYFESREAPLTKVGFKPLVAGQPSGELIYRTPEEIVGWLQSNHLIQSQRYGLL